MLDRLRAHARAASARSHTPYSGTPVGAAVLFEDGTWTAAPRLEAASFPLSIPALQGALSLAAILGGRVAAVAMSRAVSDAERVHVAQALGGAWVHAGPGAVVADGRMPPLVGEPVRLTLDLPPPPDVDGAAALAIAASDRAVVPASAFPVGAVVEDVEGRLVAGANVEVAADWTRGLCAERVALVAARAAGLGPVRRVAVACARVPGGTPCGGCRQVLAELAPNSEIVIWRGAQPPDITNPTALLPGAFGADALGR